MMNLKTKVLVSVGQDKRAKSGDALKVVSVRLPSSLNDDLKRVAQLLSHEANQRVSSGSIIRALVSVLVSEESIDISPSNPFFKEQEPETKGADARSLDPKDNVLHDMVNTEASLPMESEPVVSNPEAKPLSDNPLMDQILSSSLSAEERELLESLSNSARPVAKKWSP